MTISAATRPLIARREWQTFETEFLEANIGVLTYSQMADRLGRTKTSVAQKLRNEGLTEKRPTRDGWIQQLIDLHAKGMMYGEIGESLGKTPFAVGQAARYLGLTPNAGRPEAKERVKEKCRNKLMARMRADGMSSLAEYRSARIRIEILKMGWPQARSRIEALILESLSAGPKTSLMVSGEVQRSPLYVRDVMSKMHSRGLVKDCGRTPWDHLHRNYVLYGIAEDVARIAVPAVTRRC